MKKITFKKGFIKNKIKDEVIKVKMFTKKYEKELIIGVPITIAGLSKLSSSMIKHSTVKKEEELKNRYIYDRSIGHFWRFNRTPTNAEWIIIEKRKSYGEPLSLILLSMGLISR